MAGRAPNITKGGTKYDEDSTACGGMSAGCGGVGAGYSELITECGGMGTRYSDMATQYNEKKVS